MSELTKFTSELQGLLATYEQAPDLMPKIAAALKAAGLELVEAAELQQLKDIKLFWREEARAAYSAAVWRYISAVKEGDLKLASDLKANRISPLGAAIEDDIAGDWFDKCADCGKRLIEGEPIACYDDATSEICLPCANLESSPYLHDKYDHERDYHKARQALEGFKGQAEQAYEAAADLTKEGRPHQHGPDCACMDWGGPVPESAD